MQGRLQDFFRGYAQFFFFLVGVGGWIVMVKVIIFRFVFSLKLVRKTFGAFFVRLKCTFFSFLFLK